MLTSIISIISSSAIDIVKTPIPKDIPLPLPVPTYIAVPLLVASFMLHILFVNFMVGSSIVVFIMEIIGRKKAKYDQLAYIISKTITANKSLAVVLGVGPLLCLNLLYTTYFYSANALTGQAWLSIPPLVATVFLLVYLQKYTWHKWHTGAAKKLHIAVSGLVVAMFCFIPLIFLTNVNLMLFPTYWTKVQGFFSAMMLPNVFSRYFHFMAACVALTGMFLVWYFKGKNKEWFAEHAVEKINTIKIAYHLVFWPTVCQFILGPIVLFTLPPSGLNITTISLVLIGGVMASILLILIWGELYENGDKIGKNFNIITLLMLVIIIFMVTARHQYRESALSGHKKIMQGKTAEFVEKSLKYQLKNAK